MKKVWEFIKKHKKLCIFLVILALIVAYVIYAKNKADEMLKNLQAQAEAEMTMDVEKMDLTNAVKVTGSLQAADSSSVSYSTGASGAEVLEVFFEQGDYVNKGDLILQMDDEDAKDNLDVTNASANVSFYSAEQQVVVSSRNLANAERTYNEYYSKYAKEKDDMYLAWMNLQDVNEHKDDDRERYDEEWDWFVEKYPAAKKGDTDSVWALYENARRNFESLSTNLTDAQYAYEIANASQSQSATSNKIQRKAGEELVNDAKVTAPISGFLTSLNVNAGDIYSMSSGPLFVISDTSTYEIEATVDQYDIASIKEGLKCVVKFDSTGDEEFEGTLSYVALTPKTSGASTLGATAGSSAVEYPVKITLKSADERLRVGMTSKANIIIEEKKNVLCVPYDCVREEEGRTYVVVMNEDGTTKEVDVKCGMEGDYYIEISGDGIAEGVKIQTLSSGSAYETLMEMVSDEMNIQVVTE